jgi:D-proline reductase (dithiol) PrdB
VSVSASQHPEIRTSDGVVASLPAPEAVEEREQSYKEWAARIARPQPEGHAFVATRCEPLHWTPLAKSLESCTVALVSTGGVHLKSQDPYDVYSEHGDWSCRPIPGDVDTADLTVTHTHYATRDALEDVNVMFPLDRLRELKDEGFIGEVSALHYGFMGFIPDPGRLVDEVLPEVAQGLRDHQVDVVVLTAG